MTPPPVASRCHNNIQIESAAKTPTKPRSQLSPGMRYRAVGPAVTGVVSGETVTAFVSFALAFAHDLLRKGGIIEFPGEARKIDSGRSKVELLCDRDRRDDAGNIRHIA
jgi:hypothetical protein